MTSLWMPLVQNTLQVQAFRSSVRRSAGLRCEVVEEIQEVREDETRGPTFEFEAQLTTPTYCTGPVTFVVPSQVPEHPYGMYGMEYDEEAAAWNIFVRQISLSLTTFPAVELFPDFSMYLPKNVSQAVVDEPQSDKGEIQRLPVKQQIVNEGTAIEVDEESSSASSDISNPNETPAITNSPASEEDSMEEEKEEQVVEQEQEKVAIIPTETTRSWAEEMDDEDEEAPKPTVQDLQQSVQIPEPPTIYSVGPEVEDDFEPTSQGNDTVMEVASNDDDIFQTMINEVEDSWKPNLRAFVPKDTIDAYDYYLSCVDPNNPDQPHPESREWHMICQFNAEWFFMLQASARIKEASRLELPCLRASEYAAPPLSSNTTLPQFSEPSLIVPDHEVHHFNLLERPIKQPSTTPIEISFWATHSPGLFHKSYSNWTLRHSVCAAQAAIWICPFHIETIVNFWDGSRCVTGSALEKAAVGNVKRVYIPRGYWRNPEDATSAVDVPHFVTQDFVPVKPMLPPIVNGSVHRDIVMNDDGRPHPVARPKDKKRLPLGPSPLRYMVLCYENVSDTKALCGIVQPKLASEGVASVLTDEQTLHGEGDESSNAVVIPSVARPPTRIMLRPCSPRMVRPDATQNAVMSRDQKQQELEDDHEDNASEAETEIITDSDQPGPAAPQTFTFTSDTAPSDNIPSGARVSDWLDLSTRYHPLGNATSSSLDQDNGNAAPAEEDEYLQRLSQERPEEIITLDDTDPGNNSGCDSGEYSPIAQTLDSPLTDASAYDDSDLDEKPQEDSESSDGEHDNPFMHHDTSPDQNRYGSEALHTETEKPQENVTTDIVVYRGPITSGSLLVRPDNETRQSIHINPIALWSELVTLSEYQLPMNTQREHEEAKEEELDLSTALVLYRGPITFKEAYLATNLPTAAQGFCSGPLAFSQNTSFIQYEDDLQIPSTRPQPITTVAHVDTASILETSCTSPIIHDVDISSIPIIPLNDISETPEPCPTSPPERIYSKINTTIGRVAMKAWNVFSSSNRRDWIIDRASIAEYDGYLWEHEKVALEDI